MTNIFKKFLGELENGQFIKFFDENDGKKNLEKLNFNFPKIEEEDEIEYQSLSIKLEKNEWFFIEINELQKNNFFEKFLKLGNTTDGYNQISKENYKDLKLMFLIEGEKILFHRVQSKIFLKNKTFLKFSYNKVEVLEVEDEIDFTGEITAFFNGKDKIYFKSFYNARLIFGNEFLDAFEKMATDEEIKEFFENDFFEGDIEKVKVSSRNKKMVSVLKEKSEILKDEEKRKEFLQYAKDMKMEKYITEDGKLKFEKTSDITHILNILDEKIYKTPISGEQRTVTTYKK